MPVFLLQYFLELFPQFDVLKFLDSSFQDQNLQLIFLFISVGIVEEIVKQFLIRFIDRKYLLIQTINESIQFSLVGALGFAFAENIFYIFSIYSQFGIQQLFVTYLFRSVFTTCAHMIFSGFFGYYYGIAKFSLNIVEQSKWMGKKQRTTRFFGNLLNISNYEAYKKLTVLKGLTIAIILHAIFNLLLQFNQIILVAVFVLISYFFLRRLLSQKSGRLILIADQDNQNRSTMATKDEEVVIELLGLWFKEKKFVDVIHICQRL
ncbi:PrsW family intramembrane metalloprotease, partial [Candidatus Peregrinibacteria bacterium]|nr:PrsW family intramembrane metalloprotease [Candidatus Peregrinibacteria bacterium]